MQQHQDSVDSLKKQLSLSLSYCQSNKIRAIVPLRYVLLSSNCFPSDGLVNVVSKKNAICIQEWLRKDNLNSFSWAFHTKKSSVMLSSASTT